MLNVITDILLKVAVNIKLNINTDILLKVVLNTNNIGLRVIRYNWHIVESGIKSVLFVFNATFNNVSVITYNMEANGIRV
jgi:hypothetical protein